MPLAAFVDELEKRTFRQAKWDREEVAKCLDEHRRLFPLFSQWLVDLQLLNSVWGADSVTPALDWKRAAVGDRRPTAP
jgi:hypothetical protein